MKRVSAVLCVVLALIVQGCAQPIDTKEEKSPAITDNRPCAANFKFDGSFLTGRTFKTSVESPLPKKTAFSDLVTSIASRGYAIASTDKESGLISANNPVRFGKGSTVPLNATIKDIPSGGSHVDLIFHISGGQTVPVDAVKKEFCEILEPISAQN
jgi:hypothetical protein